jgi:alkylhydroperoxidase family enzyme
VAAKGDEGVVRAILNDFRTAPIDERLRATLAFLEKLTLSPAEVGPLDIEPMRAAGASDRAIREAIYVCTLFNIIDRIADAMSFDLATPEQSRRAGQHLLKRGYGTSSLPG